MKNIKSFNKVVVFTIAIILNFNFAGSNASAQEQVLVKTSAYGYDSQTKILTPVHAHLNHVCGEPQVCALDGFEQEMDGGTDHSHWDPCYGQQLCYLQNGEPKYLHVCCNRLRRKQVYASSTSASQSSYGVSGSGIDAQTAFSDLLGIGQLIQSFRGGSASSEVPSNYGFGGQTAHETTVNVTVVAPASTPATAAAPTVITNTNINKGGNQNQSSGAVNLTATGGTNNGGSSAVTGPVTTTANAGQGSNGGTTTPVVQPSPAPTATPCILSPTKDGTSTSPNGTNFAGLPRIDKSGIVTGILDASGNPYKNSAGQFTYPNGTVIPDNLSADDYYAANPTPAPSTGNTAARANGGHRNAAIDNKSVAPQMNLASNSQAQAKTTVGQGGLTAEQRQNTLNLAPDQRRAERDRLRAENAQKLASVTPATLVANAPKQIEAPAAVVAPKAADVVPTAPAARNERRLAGMPNANVQNEGVAAPAVSADKMERRLARQEKQAQLVAPVQPKAPEMQTPQQAQAPVVPAAALARRQARQEVRAQQAQVQVSRPVVQPVAPRFVAPPAPVRANPNSFRAQQRQAVRFANPPAQVRQNPNSARAIARRGSR